MSVGLAIEDLILCEYQDFGTRVCLRRGKIELELELGLGLE